MGVPRLFPYIQRNFPTDILYFKTGEFVKKVDYLLIDSNAIIHSVAQKVFKYGKFADTIQDTLSFSEKTNKLYEECINEIIKLTKCVIPRKALFISVDGVAPLSKQSQQRKRRFLSAMTNSTNEFDSNAITCGTEFMESLEEFTKLFIIKELSKDVSDLDNIDIYYSGPRVAGEGEHKIMKFIRDMEKISHQSYCIYSPDADLIMLELALHIKDIYLLREDQFKPEFSYFISMAYVRNDLGQSMKLHRSINDVSDDFIFIGFFVGNDFIPKIRMFLFLEDGLQQMIWTYNQTFQNKYPLTISSKVSLEGLKKFLIFLEKYEKKFIYEQSQVQTEDRFINHMLLRNIHNNVFNFETYRKEYYAKANVKNVRQMCLDYLKSLLWVFDYYHSLEIEWLWYYKYHYAPLITDLALTVRSLDDVDFVNLTIFLRDEPPKPFVQLLSVLPFQSKNLLPVEYRDLFADKPLQFEIDYEGITKEHMAPVLLDFVDYNEIKKKYDSVIPKEKYKRNTTGNLLKFFVTIDENNNTKVETTKKKSEERIKGISSYPKCSVCLRKDIPQRMMTSDMNQIEYKTGGKVSNGKHWGQRKLLMSEIEFLCDYSDKNDVVVYAGAAQGFHVPFLSEMFPSLKFILYDPAKFAIRETNTIKIIQDFFTEDTAKEYINKNVLFISDIRTETDEKSVSEDMKRQKRWVGIMDPKACMFKFRLPWGVGYTEYFSGDIYFQPYARDYSTETRLICEKPYSLMKYNNGDYEEKCFYLNSVVRFHPHLHNVYEYGLDNTWDSACEVYILDNYLSKTVSDYEKLSSKRKNKLIGELSWNITKTLKGQNFTKYLNLKNRQKKHKKPSDIGLGWICDRCSYISKL